MSYTQSQRNDSPAWPQALAEVTVMDKSLALQALCIEQEDDEGVEEFAERKDKFQLKLLTGSSREKKETSLLIEKRYSWRGYNGAATLDQLPNRMTMNAELFGRIYATLTVNVDSPAGLSVEDTYPEEVEAFRKRGARVCEFGKFAVEPSVRSKRLLGTLFHLLYIYAHRVQGCTDILIEVNPRHRFFYLRYLEFKQIAEEKVCPRVGAPALLLHLSSEHIRRRISELAGRWRELPDEKSLYKYMLPQPQEDEIVLRLIREGTVPDAPAVAEEEHLSEYA
ncbi:MAG: hypothetical protein KDG52_00315 [Rhodocyclaceae bacterium]|nr:hypothetical protein [Rhodocyclaceae bacterium]